MTYPRHRAGHHSRMLERPKSPQTRRPHLRARATRGGSLSITIPRYIVRHWKLKAGMRLVVRSTDARDLLYPRYFLPYSRRHRDVSSNRRGREYSRVNRLTRLSIRNGSTLDHASSASSRSNDTGAIGRSEAVRGLVLEELDWRSLRAKRNRELFHIACRDVGVLCRAMKLNRDGDEAGERQRRPTGRKSAIHPGRRKQRPPRHRPTGRRPARHSIPLHKTRRGQPPRTEFAWITITSGNCPGRAGRARIAGTSSRPLRNETSETMVSPGPEWGYTKARPRRPDTSAQSGLAGSSIGAATAVKRDGYSNTRARHVLRLGMPAARDTRVRGRRPASTGTMLARAVERTVELAVAEGMNREVLKEAAGLTRTESRGPRFARACLGTSGALAIDRKEYRRSRIRCTRGSVLEGPRGRSHRVRHVLQCNAQGRARTIRALQSRAQRCSRSQTRGAPPAARRHRGLSPGTWVGLPFAVDYRLSALLSVCRQITGVEIVPVEVAFAYPQRASTFEHRRFFRCPLLFDRPQSKLVFSQNDLKLPIPRANEALAGYLSSHAETVLRSLVTGESTQERVRSAIWAMLSEGRPTVSRIAAALQLPPRTLQRHLAREGTSLQRELEEVRKNMAMAMLRDLTTPIDEVAFLLGYAEPSTLFRSFKRWTGITPDQYRAAAA